MILKLIKYLKNLYKKNKYLFNNILSKIYYFLNIILFYNYINYLKVEEFVLKLDLFDFLNIDL